MPVSLGSSQCLGPLWQGDYYPNDLPDDWRLDYYANDYSAVLLPAQVLSQGWLQEIDWPEGLKTVVEIAPEDPGREDWPLIHSRLQKLQSQGAVIVGSDRRSHTLEQAGLSIVYWHDYPEGVKLAQVSENHQIIHREIPEAADLRELRQWLERLDADREIWLFLDAAPEVLARVRVLLELMGI